jgi:hypothetical protein
MIAQKINTEKLFVCLDETSAELLQLVHAVDVDIFNAVPFANSWTAGQVIVHVIKSNLAIAKALKLEGKTMDRDPDERVNELKDLFLDFTIKFQSPDFILPPEMNYNKEEIVRDFLQSIGQLKEGSNDVNLAEAITHEAFGEITKLELLYFVLFHTQRHMHQLQNILTHLFYKKNQK